MTFSGHLENVYSIALIKRGQTLISGGKDKTIRLWDTFSGSSRIMTTADSSVHCIAVASDETTIACGTFNGVVEIFDIIKRERRHWWRVSSQPIYALCFDREGQYLAAGGNDGIVRVFRRGESKPLHMSREGKAILSAAFSPDGLLIATGSVDGFVTIWGYKAERRSENQTRRIR
jgi:WD40 repeat protein